MPKDFVANGLEFTAKVAHIFSRSQFLKFYDAGIKFP